MEKNSILIRSTFVSILYIFLMVACASLPEKKVDLLRVGGASDVLYLIKTVNNDFSSLSGLSMDVMFSADAINDLRTGKIDVAIIGRELTPSESGSLEITTIAYDAVCILIERNTYRGGIMTVTQADNVIAPVAKFVGLKNLSLDELRQHLRNLLLLNPRDNPWSIPGIGIYSFEPYLDINGYSGKVDPETQTLKGTWVFNNVYLGGSLSPVGQFDTQKVMLQKVGLENVEIDNELMSVIGNYLDSEELWISNRFKIEDPNRISGSNSGYSLFLMPVSREVTIRAIQHGFGVVPIMIDGIDPLSSPSVIYDGTYPLSRKIYLVTMKSSSIGAQQFIKYMLSEEGQKMVENASFLPLSSTNLYGNHD